MRINGLYMVVGLIIAFCLFAEFVAHADERNESTKITFSAPVQIPGRLLPAGTYIFQQADPDRDPKLIQIFSEDRSVVYATLETASAEHTKLTANTEMTLAEPGSGNPAMLVTWFYPGSLTGHEFLYTQQQEQEIAEAQQETFVGNHVQNSTQHAGE